MKGPKRKVWGGERTDPEKSCPFCGQLAQLRHCSTDPQCIAAFAFATRHKIGLKMLKALCAMNLDDLDF